MSSKNFRRAAKRGRKKRVVGRRLVENGSNYKPIPQINRFPVTTLCPDRILVKLNYTVKFDVTNTGTAIQKFHGNSPYDPDPAVGGFSAAGFQPWMQFYQYYKVVKSSIDVTAVPDLSASSVLDRVFEIITLPETNGSLSLSADNAISAKYSKRTQVVDEGRNLGRVVNKMETEKIYGLHNLEHWNFFGTVSTDPAAVWYWYLYVRPFSTALKGFFTVRITYWTEFMRRNASIAQSVPEYIVNSGQIVGERFGDQREIKHYADPLPTNFIVERDSSLPSVRLWEVS